MTVDTGDKQEPGSTTISPSGVPRLTVETGWNAHIDTDTHRDMQKT